MEDAQLAWGVRTDVGLVRGHNEDAYTLAPPLFAVCDGMGGHEAGEVASAIAAEAIEKNAPDELDDVALGAAIEAANLAIINSAEQGVGKAGMGCTATAVMLVGEKMAVAHVGDSRCYLLRGGTLVRVTHDHSYVEELVDAGEITADEARVHPARSIITRALGSDPELYADHFTLDVEKGDRIILCSDGLNSMVPDDQIEDVAITSPTPQDCANGLVDAALASGGHDNVTVLVIDVSRDVVAESHARQLRKRARNVVLAVLAVALLTMGLWGVLVNSSYFVGSEDGHVAIFKGLKGNILGFDMYELSEFTDVMVNELPSATRNSLETGVVVSGEQEARDTVASYRTQIQAERDKAAEDARAATGATPDSGAVAPASPEIPVSAVAPETPVEAALTPAAQPATPAPEGGAQ